MEIKNFDKISRILSVVVGRETTVIEGEVTSIDDFDRCVVTCDETPFVLDLGKTLVVGTKVMIDMKTGTVGVTYTPEVSEAKTVSTQVSKPVRAPEPKRTSGSGCKTAFDPIRA